MFEVIKQGLETSVQDYPGELVILTKGFLLQGQWIVGLFDLPIYL